MVAEVTVFPVPGGPWIRLKGRCNTVFTAYTCATANSTGMSFRGDTGTASTMFLQQVSLQGGFAVMSEVQLGPHYLRVVEIRQALRGEAFGQLTLDDHILHLVSQQLVVNVARHRRLVHGESLQGTLHPGITRET